MKIVIMEMLVFRLSVNQIILTNLRHIHDLLDQVVMARINSLSSLLAANLL